MYRMYRGQSVEVLRVAKYGDKDFNSPGAQVLVRHDNGEETAVYEGELSALALDPVSVSEMPEEEEEVLDAEEEEEDDPSPSSQPSGEVKFP